MWQLCHEASENTHNALDEIRELFLQQLMEECARDISYVRLHVKEMKACIAGEGITDSGTRS